jgi:hypothetical protein
VVEPKTFRLPIIVGVLFFMSVAPALGEFESPKKESTGKGEVVELKLEGGGVKVACQNFAESPKSVAWTIENEEKATTKGPGLLLDIENWGECTAESSGLKEVKAEISKCELEIQQPKAEKEVSGAIVKSCTIKAGSCEIKAEASENKSLKLISIFSSGEESENLILEPAINDVTTTASCTCAGIKSTTEGKLTGFIELHEVQAAARSEFSVSAIPINYSAGNLTGKIKITNKGAAQKPAGWGRLTFPGGSFSANAMEEKTCETKMYAANESCTFDVKWESIRGFASWLIEDMNGAKADGVVRGR